MRQVKAKEATMFVATVTPEGVSGEVIKSYGPFTSKEKAIEFAHEFELVTGGLDPADDFDGRGDLEEDLGEMGWFFVEVEHVDEDEPDFTPLAVTHQTFGPGKLENIHLYKYADNSAQVVGTYRIYCGMGNEHTFAVDSGREDPEAITALDEILDARGDGPDTIGYNYDLAEAMVDEVIEEEWSDPCDAEIDAHIEQNLENSLERGTILQPKTFDINDLESNPLDPDLD